MKKYLVMMMMIAVTTLTLGVSTAEAKRVGGGGSVGKQSQSVSQAPAASQAAKPAAATAAAPAAAAPKPASPWKGILGGALLGLGLGALFSSLGLGGAMGGMLGSLLMVAALGIAAMFIYRMWRSKSQQNGPQPAAASAFGGATPDIGSRIEPMQYQAQPAQPTQTGASYAESAAAGAAQNAAPWGIPADFDSASFLRHAKTHFIRLQAAWDRSDINDIREFTTPEMYAELKLQLQERGTSANVTDVVTLNGELMGIETIGNDYLASVKFTGMIREADHAPTEPFAEVWNLSKPVTGTGGWVLAGIQQLG